MIRVLVDSSIRSLKQASRPRRHWCGSLVTMLLLCHMPALWAATPAFTYQGHLLDQSAPANGNFDVQLTLFDADAGGLAVGSTLLLEDVPVTNGLFQVELDFGAATFTGDDRWIELGLRPAASLEAFTVLAPRQRLNPVPYALFALAGNQGPEGPSGPPGPPGSADAWARSGNADTDPVSEFLGTTDERPFQIRVSNQPAMLMQPHADGPRIGINTQSPQFTLHLNGDGFIEGDLGIEGVLTANFASGSVGASALALNSVGSSAIENNSITSDDIADGSIALTDLDAQALDDRYVDVTGDSMTGDLTTPSLRTSLIRTESIIAATSPLNLESAADLALKIDRRGSTANATFRVSNGANQSLFELAETGEASIPSNLDVGSVVTVGEGVAVGDTTLDPDAMLQLNLPAVAGLPHLRLKAASPSTGFGLQFVNADATWTVGPNLDLSGDDRFHILADASNKGLVVATDGNVGVGDLTNQSPFATFTVDGTIGFTDVSSPMMYVYPSGTANPAKPLIVHSPNFPGYGVFYQDDGDRFVWQSSSQDTTPSLVVDLDSNWVSVASPVPKPGYEFSVNGQIVCEDLLIEDSSLWPDYVFAEDYPLKSLAEVESHIRQFGHLPDTPTADQVHEHGITVGAMQRTMMQKIEELTLHAIEQEKRLARQEQRIRELEARLSHTLNP